MTREWQHILPVCTNIQRSTSIDALPVTAITDLTLPSRPSTWQALSRNPSLLVYPLSLVISWICRPQAGQRSRGSGRRGLSGISNPHAFVYLWPQAVSSHVPQRAYLTETPVTISSTRQDTAAPRDNASLKTPLSSPARGAECCHHIRGSTTIHSSGSATRGSHRAYWHVFTKHTRLASFGLSYLL